jgi:hypothetical protein
MSLKDALVKAYIYKGLVPPTTAKKQNPRNAALPAKKFKIEDVPVSYGESKGGRGANKRRTITQAVKQQSTGSVISLQRKLTKAESTNQARAATISEQTVNLSKPVIQTLRTVVVTSPVTMPSVAVAPDARCLVTLSKGHSFQLLKLPLALGKKVSIHRSMRSERHEMTLGLDFGTSSVKVVIGDLAADKTYAVPFLKADGIDAYLLPSRVFEAETDEGQMAFDLAEGGQAFRDLKLGLLGNPHSLDRQLEVIAFLAHVMRRARAWLFETHKSIYKNVHCLWQLRIGLPAASALGNQYVPLLETIVLAAWRAAALDTPLTRDDLLQLRESVVAIPPEDQDVEVEVIPEIAAQIYGFVVSTSFDKKAPNRYLMVDVGAGTVDSSLFKVVPARGGRWNIEFYTAVVQPYGVSNLHAHRVDWWVNRLTDVQGMENHLLELRETKFATDLGPSLPIRNQDYFQGINFSNHNPDKSDFDFFDKLMDQVRGTTLWRAWKDGFLAKEQLTGIPMFLCGGGARSEFYLQLEEKLVHMPSYAWLCAEAWQLGYPDGDLEAEGIDQTDFDRLSVAYGLSKINVGQITQAIPLPMVRTEQTTTFTDRYIDKDQI